MLKLFPSENVIFDSTTTARDIVDGINAAMPRVRRLLEEDPLLAIPIAKEFNSVISD